MRAHFADSVPASPDSIDEIAAEPLESRIKEFKQDPKNMAVLSEFIDDVLVKAETEASKHQSEQDSKKSQQATEKTRQYFKNGTKVVHRARGFVVRIFDAICNCANNASAAAPAARFKLRTGKRQPSQQANDVETEVERPETLALNKPESKQKNGKEKKSEGGKQKTKGVKIADETEAIEMLQD